MNRLRKKAVKDFGNLCVTTILGFLIFGFASYTNIKGLPWIVGLVFMLLCIGISFFLNVQKDKKQFVSEFDEREFCLLQRAINIGNNSFMGYAVIAMLIAFSLIGGRALVPMWTIPLMLFMGFFLGGTVQFFVMMHYTKEDDKNIEGDVE
jgi:hypothetical protein